MQLAAQAIQCSLLSVDRCFSDFFGYHMQLDLLLLFGITGWPIKHLKSPSMLSKILLTTLLQATFDFS